MTLTAGKLWGMRRMADAEGRFKMTAVDQRPPIKNPIKEKLGLDEAPWAHVADFKKMLIEELQAESSAMLLDPHYAYPHGISVYSPTKGLIVTLEDSVFEETPEGRISSEIDDWSVEKIKRVGGDAVKVLTWYRPDALAALCQQQQDFTARIGEACAKYDIPYVFELLVYPLASDSEQTTDYVEMKSKKPDLVIESVRTFADPKFGVDLFKVESPLAASDVPGTDGDGASGAQAYFEALGEAAGRPWVMLSAGAGKADFKNILTHAYAAGASGYLAGRAIWLDAFQHFPDWDQIRTGLKGDAAAYMKSLNDLTDEYATPWTSHPLYAEHGAGVFPADGTFRHRYAGMGV
ncbi:MAG: tagatose 1,6-diphosphate aldolase [Pseudomonadota bacterium]